MDGTRYADGADVEILRRAGRRCGIAGHHDIRAVVLARSSLQALTSTLLIGGRRAPDRRVHCGAHRVRCLPPAWAIILDSNWETRVALLIWLAIAPNTWAGSSLISTLDSLGIAAGKIRISVWSVLKLLFTLTFSCWRRLDQPLGRTAREKTHQRRALDPHWHREIRQCILSASAFSSD